MPPLEGFAGAGSGASTGTGVQQVSTTRLAEIGQQLGALGEQVPAEVNAPLAAALDQALAGWKAGATRAQLEHELHPVLRQQVQAVGRGLGRVGMVLSEASGGYAGVVATTAARMRGGPGSGAVGALDDEPRVMGSIPQVVNLDPKNPPPYDKQIPAGLEEYTKKVAAEQQKLGGKWKTIGGAIITRDGADPVETGIKMGDAKNTHAEAQTVNEVKQLLGQGQGSARVDLVTENLPCPDQCTPTILSGKWYQDMQGSAGKGSDVDFRVWHHGMGARGPDGRLPGDLTLYSYELPPAMAGEPPVPQRRLYISPDMWKKMNWNPEANAPIDPDEPYLTVPPGVKVISGDELQSLLS